MAKFEQRITALELQAKKSKPFIETPEFLADMQMVREYFETTGRKQDTMPRDDMTKVQREILAALIKFEESY